MVLCQNLQRMHSFVSRQNQLELLKAVWFWKLKELSLEMQFANGMQFPYRKQIPVS